MQQGTIQTNRRQSTAGQPGVRGPGGLLELDGLNWHPLRASHMGCLKSCIDYLELDVSNAWLYGGSGHAFLLNIDEALCPSGPTAWDTAMLFRLLPNVGVFVVASTGHRSQADFAAVQAAAFEQVQDGIRNGWPSYAWELQIPEYYLIHACDEAGYYFKGPGVKEGQEPKAWQDLGTSEIGWLEMYTVRRGQTIDPQIVVKVALAFAAEVIENPEGWQFDGYHMGLEGYDAWIQALDGREASSFGMAYNAAVWAECREFARAFLEEAKALLACTSRTIFDDAIAEYDTVAANLKLTADMFPFEGATEEEMEANFHHRSRRKDAIVLLKAAKEAEARGVGLLKDLAAAL